jgi:branched-chain amino acid transport system permease protein
MFTSGFGAALSGAGGALLAPITAVVPSMGQVYVGRAFMTVVVGGPGVLSGTVSASGLLGSVNSVVSNLTTSVLGTAALLVIAIVLLRFLPTGISGRWGRKS